MASATRPLAIVTGASAGIGYELAKVCAQNGFDLLVAADQPKIAQAAQEFRTLGVEAEAVQADLATLEGVDKLYAPLRDDRWTPSWPMPAMGSAKPSSIRTSMMCGT